MRPNRKQRIADSSDEEEDPLAIHSAVRVAGNDDVWAVEDSEDEIKVEEVAINCDDDSDSDSEDPLNVKDTSQTKKRKGSERMPSDLDEDDYDLLEENTGGKVKRPNRFKRIRQIEEPDSGDDWKSESEDGSVDYDDDDDFIDDDLGASAKAKRKKKAAGNQAKKDSPLRSDNHYKPVSNDNDDWDADDDDGGGYKAPKSRSKRPTNANDDDGDDDWDDGDDNASRSGYSTKGKPQRSAFVYLPQEVIRRTAAPKDELQIEAEAHWIYNRIFTNRRLLCLCEICREDYEPFEAMASIQRCLEALVEGYEEIDGETIDDVCFRRLEDLDKRWSELIKRKAHLKEQLQHMRTYLQTVDRPTVERPITEVDLDTANEVQSIEEWKDAHDQFMFYYAAELPQMRKHLQLEDAAEEVSVVGEKKKPVQRKQPLAFGPYRLYARKGIGNFAKLFGLTSEQYAENVFVKERVYEVKDSALSPLQVAEQYVPSAFSNLNDAIKAAQFMVAKQLACEPKLRKAVRAMINKHSTVSVQPTKRGRGKIDTSHPFYSLMYLKKKPLRDLAAAEWLNIMQGVEQNLLEVDIDEEFGYVEQAKEYFKSTNVDPAVSAHTRAWDGLRADCIEKAIKTMIIPEIVKELRAALQEEAGECERGLNCKCKKFVYGYKKNPFNDY